MASHYITAATAINALITSEHQSQLIVGRSMRAESGRIRR